MDHVHLEDWLARNVWLASPLRIFMMAIGLALVAFFLENACELSFDFLLTYVGLDSRFGAIEYEQEARFWVSPLVISPMLENLLCLVWLRSFFSAERWG